MFRPGRYDTIMVRTHNPRLSTETSMTVVPIETVKIASGHEYLERDIPRVGEYLKAEGLIEPLKMSTDGMIGRIDPYDTARLEWCRRNGWKTVIVAFDN